MACHTSSIFSQSSASTAFESASASASETESDPTLGSKYTYSEGLLHPYMGLLPVSRPDDPWTHKAYDPHHALYTGGGSYAGLPQGQRWAASPGYAHHAPDSAAEKPTHTRHAGAPENPESSYNKNSNNNNNDDDDEDMDNSGRNDQDDNELDYFRFDDDTDNVDDSSFVIPK
ncbi:GL14590 [Drosophila persimilis]|uniref:GL14590 n=1 Tax=Drosophila persimilis TaxID=7234 RepID=B4GVW5_DROPE|nr:GL14590 [Drosophila persimilis]